ncbi:caspase-6-like isoform X1 [Danio aesculapii]|uniref:caspase-6-like isoform X1 n=1 Tax=Danio aesculapii TaxID=1142201 RepID=UPI0024BFA567|nr:caspase-6-like isoform X1 [Danio aesculapii]XP_056307423.1 caspase-6-like isoform X1 [Danio aesculapii]
MATNTKSQESENTTESDGCNQSMDPNLEYTMKHARRGMALIFNQKNFDCELKVRKGTDADRDNLVSRFKELDFEVKAYNDYSQDDVLFEIKKPAAANHKDADCFVCIFLSHGGNGHVYAKDGQIDIPEITDLFKGDKCRSLVGKPKIFIWQACRGDKKDDPVTPMSVEDCDDEMDVDAGVLPTLPAGADFIMCYSTAEGQCFYLCFVVRKFSSYFSSKLFKSCCFKQLECNVPPLLYYNVRLLKINFIVLFSFKGFSSFRNSSNGSWYIQDLCKILGRYHSELEFTNILTLVNMEVSSHSVLKSEDLSFTGKKQMPCFASMLTKRLFFRPKK